MNEQLYQVFEYLNKRDECETGNDYNGLDFGARISSIFVILITGAFGCFFPVLSSRYSFIKLPSWCFFLAKYFGSGVIVATAFIHLLEPASDALGNECLTGVIAEYPWADSSHQQSHSHFGDESNYVKKDIESNIEDDQDDDNDHVTTTTPKPNPYPSHFQHSMDHQDPQSDPWG
ncbi:uncharacterized protein J8A68_001020 [[Candida] subhashii]|uniref:Uncharacterized protein n=1 Tax=[Candida] subhashii TaxID=561895 RepID=A0A8J5QV15_9ASCO|nr:uncharacterized protein J8A68_001020 [[Candida] subhashii]KAG7665332.1 hypothetical protein J8A68_001020 [[Candida] subhashii]